MKDRIALAIGDRILLIGSLLFVLLACFWGNLWVLDSCNWFVFDDWCYLAKSKLIGLDRLLRVLPAEKFNDRPIGLILLIGLYRTWGMNAQAHHAVLLSLHLLNVFLLWRMVHVVMDHWSLTGKYRYLPALSAAFFGLWPNSLMCVQWNSAVFDLFGVTLFLLSINIYVQARQSSKSAIVGNVLVLVTYLLAIRTKETFILLPLIFVLFEWCVARTHSQERKERNFIVTKISLVIMCFYTVYLLAQPSAAVEDPTGAYYLSANPLISLRNIWRYGSLYFGFSVRGFHFTSYDPWSSLLMGLFLLYFVGSVFTAFRRENFWLLFLFFAAGLVLLPVLPMENMQNLLYLYAPSIFVSILLSFAALFLVNSLCRRESARGVSFVLLVGGLLLLGQAPRVKLDREWWCSVGTENLKTYQALKQMPKFGSETTIYVQGLTNSTHAFHYGPGCVTMIISDTLRVKTFLNPATIDRTRPYMVLRYEGGDVRLVEQGPLE